MPHSTSSKISAIKLCKTKIEDKYYASGLKFTVTEIGEEGMEIMNVVIDGEEMKPIREALLIALESSLKFRLALRKSELKEIQDILGEL